MDEKKSEKTTKKASGKKSGGEKKKPGRPRLKPVRDAIPKNGIAKEPNKSTNAMELIYDNPDAFKKIFNMFKAMMVDTVTFTFQPDKAIIRARDHYGKSDISVVINGNRMNHYYCDETFSIKLNANTVGKIIRIIDNKYITITLITKKAERHKSLHIVYKNDIKIDEYREINLIDTGALEPCDNLKENTHQVKFTLPSKFFKKMIGDISGFTDYLVFEKAGEGPLTYRYDNVTMKCKHVVKDPKMISFESTMGPEDIFGATIVLDYIKALSGSLISKHITIFASSKCLIFQSIINPTDAKSKAPTTGDIEIKVRTATADFKNIRPEM